MSVVSVVATSGYLVVGIVIAGAGISKLRSSDDFAKSLRGYRVLPPRLTPAAAPLIALAEVTVGCGLLGGVFSPVAGYAAVALLLVILGAVVSVLVRGISTECGCLGIRDERVTSRTVGRLVVILAILAAAMLAAPEGVIDPTAEPMAYATGFAVAIAIRAATTLTSHIIAISTWNARQRVMGGQMHE